jgi:hypothetical protein
MAALRQGGTRGGGPHEQGVNGSTLGHGVSSREEEIERARRAGVESVRDVFSRTREDEPPLRRCRSCGNEERNRWGTCTRCGRSYYADPPRVQRARRGVLVAVAIVLVAGLAIWVPHLLSTKSHNEVAQRAARARLVAAETARLRREQRPHSGRVAGVATDSAGLSPARRLALRAAALAAVRAAVTVDARARRASGVGPGAVRTTQCGPLVRVTQGARVVNPTDDRDLTVRIGRFDCTAVQRNVVQSGRVVGLFGIPYVGVIDFATGRYVFCKNTPAQSEAGSALAQVRLARVCFNAHGAPLREGYLIDPRDAHDPLPGVG